MTIVMQIDNECLNEGTDAQADLTFFAGLP